MGRASTFVRFLRACRNALFGTPHRHTWEILKKVDCVSEAGGLPTAFEYHLRCTACGNMKKFRA